MREELVSTVTVAVVDCLVEFRVADMKLPGIDTNNWPLRKLISGALQHWISILTIFIMKILQVEGKLTSFHNIVVKLVPRCCGSKFWPRKSRQRAEKQSVDCEAGSIE